MSFVPTDLPNLWAWYDAGEGVTGGTSVTVWQDQTGNGNHLTSISGHEPELLPTGLNSLGVIQKAASIDAEMDTASFVPDLSTLGGTIFLVAKQAVTGDANGPFLQFGTSQSVSIRRSGASADRIRFGVNSTSGATNNDKTGVTDGTYHTLRLRVDNVNQYGSVNAGSESTLACILGSYAGGTIMKVFGNGTAYGDKSIAEILIYTRDLDMTELGQVELYLKTKYNHY